MHLIAAREVHRLLDYPALVEGLKKFHLRDIDEARDIHISQPVEGGSEAVLLVLPAWRRGEALGVKLVSIFPDNPHDGSGLPSIQGVYVLFEGRHGRPLAVIDGTALTLRKTAADSATGASYLAREDAEVMLMVGAGAMAPHLVMAHAAVRPSLRRVRVWNRGTERARRLVRSLALDGVALEATEDLEGACRRADVICCATMAETPLIRGDWLRPGAHLDLVGGYTPVMREADDACVLRSRIFVDSRMFSLGRVGDIKTPLDAGIIGEDDIRGDLFQLARGEVEGRTRRDEITLFKNAGGGHLDLATACFLLSRLEREEAGATAGDNA